jgi:peptidyl-prolyl cis-trans isomerase D
MGDQQETWAAKVDDHPIDYNTYLRHYKQLVNYYQEMFKDSLGPEGIEQLGLKQKALDSLIDQTVLLEVGRKAGLNISDSEIKDRIQSLEMFQTEGAFDLQKYQQLLRINRIQPQEFEESQRQEAMAYRVKTFVQSAAKSSGDELWEQFVAENEQARLEYVEVDPEKTELKEAAKPEEVEAYYMEDRERFRAPAKITLAYVEFAPKEFKKMIEISDQEIREYYDEYAEEFWKPEQVRARHILIKVDGKAKPEEKEEARKKAEDVLAEAKKGTPFEELAKKFSEDKASAKEGGDLGLFPRGQMVGPFEEAAFGLAPGEVSEVVETPFGFHIIRTEEKIPEGTKPLDEVKDDIRQALFDAQAAELVRKEAFRTYRSVLKEKDLTVFAKDNELRVVTTRPFSRQEGHAIFSGSADAINEAFTAEPGGLIYPFTAAGSYYVVQINDKQEEYVPELEEVKDEIEDIVEKQHRKAAARRHAQKLLAAAKDAGVLENVAEKAGLEIKKTRFFARSGRSVPGLGSSPEIMVAAFCLTAESPYPEDVFEHKEKFFIFRLAGKEKALREEFEMKRDQLRKREAEQKKIQYLGGWLQHARAQSQIVVNAGAIQ